MSRASSFMYCKMCVAKAGADVCTKVEGSGVVLVKEGASGCGSTVGRGRSTALTRCWFTAVGVALMIVSINCCEGRGKKNRFTVGDPRGACGSNAGV